MGEKYGAPYNTFPFTSMEFGKSATGWGGTCGSLLGGAIAISLFYPRKIAIPLQKELYRWYEVTALPIYQPMPGEAKIDTPLAQNVSDSILCHISVARWCNKSGFAAKSKERSERCGRITADVAKKTAELIYAQMDKDFTPVLTTSDLQKSCRTEGCHGDSPDKWEVTNLKGSMDCAPCHTGGDAVSDKRINHP